MNYPNLCVVDTNVVIKANLANDPDSYPDELKGCVNECLNAIKHVHAKKCLVLDSGDKILDEYLRHLPLSSRQPGIVYEFIKWVHDNRYSLPESQRVEITENGDSFNEFPQHEGLTNFDLSDRKFVAVSNAHPQKPAILQATDSKWWGWKGALEECGIKVQFLCPDYIRAKYEKKIGE